MGNANIKYLTSEESEEELTPAALDLMDHIVEILTADYIESMKTTGEDKTP